MDDPTSPGATHESEGQLRHDSEEHFEDGSEDDEEEDFDTLEYARFHGLTEDYLAEDPRVSYALIPAPEDLFEALKDPENLPSADRVSVEDMTRERLQAGPDALILLQKAVQPELEWRPLDHVEDKPRRKQRMELPLLPTDHEMDVRKWGRTAEPNWRAITFPLEHVDIEADEGLEWPKKLENLGEEMWRKAESEKLQGSIPGLTLLHDVQRDPTMTKEELEDFYRSFDSKYKRKKRLPMTPPLVPLMSPLLTPFDPSSETAQLPLLSDSTDTLMGEASALDTLLQHRDRLRAPNFESSEEPNFDNTDDFARIHSPLQSALGSDASAPPRLQKREDLMVDVPLLPEDASSTPKLRKSVSFAKDIRTVIPSDLLEPLPFKQPSPPSEETWEALFNEYIVPLGEEANRAAEQEQLQEADTLHRVQVPVMDFSIATPPWKTFTRSSTNKAKTELEAQQKLLQEISASDLQLPECGPWKVAKSDEMKMPWIPFPPEIAKTAHDEVIDDTRYIAVIMSDMSTEDVVTSDQLVWKPEGLRIMRKDEYEDEELEVASWDDEDEREPDWKDMNALIRKRKRQLEAPIEAVLRIAGPPMPTIGQSQCQSHLSVEADGDLVMKDTHLDRNPQSGGFFGSIAAAAGSLGSFMTSMGQENKRPRLEPTAPPKEQVRTTAQAVSKLPKVLEPGEAPAEPAAMAPYALLSLPAKLRPAYFVLSSAILQSQRPLLREIQKLYSSANFIERDFAAISKAPEADIVLSPSTGLLFTTLQKIRQKALPGHEGQLSGIRDRLVKVAVRYENLIVLVAEALSISGGELDERDCEAIADFTSFCGHLKAESHVLLVPSGEQNLALWTVSVMHQNAMDESKLALLPDETLWEQLLRRIGLNAFAAQAVLVDLKQPPQESSTSSEGATEQQMVDLTADFGIGAFMRMSPEQRTARYEGLIGRRVLNRVNRVLEQQWLSAKTGFA